MAHFHVPMYMYNIPVFTDLFQIAATTLNVDIIIIEVTQKLPYPIKRPSINVVSNSV